MLVSHQQEESGDKTTDSRQAEPDCGGSDVGPTSLQEIEANCSASSAAPAAEGGNRQGYRPSWRTQRCTVESLDLGRWMRSVRLQLSNGAEAFMADFEGIDKWATWLLTRRFGSDPAEKERLTYLLGPIRERILENAHIGPGETVIDVGTGTGFLGFAAIEKIGGSGKIIFNDISDDLIEYCKKVANSLEVVANCEYVKASAEDLNPLVTSSADVVLSKSVLMYVQNKEAVFKEYFRVLRNMGRFSCFEPVNRPRRTRPTGFFGYEPGPYAGLCDEVLRYFGDAKSNAGPMHDWDERDLFEYARAAGFKEIQLELRTFCSASPRAKSWNHFLDECSNPTVPSIREALDLALTLTERDRLTSYMKPLVEQGIGLPVISSFVFFSGRKV